MNTQQSAVDLRHQIVGGLLGPADDSLVNLSTYKLPDGAEAYVVATGGTYRLNKSLTPGTNPGFEPLYVTPAVGPGIWVLQTSGNASASVGFEGAETFSAAAPTSVVALNWHALPTGATFYEATAGGPDWVISTTTGILTYSGAEKRFLVTATFSAYCSTTEGSFQQALDVDISVNGELLGTTADEQDSSQVALGNPGVPSALTHQSLITVSPGDHVQHVFRTLVDGTDSVGFTRYAVIITVP